MPSLSATYLPSRVRVQPRSLKAYAGYLVPSMLMLALAFPGPGWGFLAHFALAPMVLLALRAHSTWRLAWTSYVAASIWWLVMIRWMQPVTTGGWVGLSLVTALFTPASLLALRWLDQRFRVAMILAVPLVWVSFEFLRCHHPSGGFAWFTLAQTQASYAPEHGISRLLQVSDLFGASGVSFLVAMTNGLLVDLMHRPWIKPTLSGKRTARTIRVALFVWAAVLTAALFYGQIRIRGTESAWTVGVRVAVIQTNVPQSNKVFASEEQEKRDWDHLVDMTREAAAALRPTVIVWPETMVPAALNPEALEHYRVTQTRMRGADRYQRKISELADELNVTLVVGAAANEQWSVIEGPEGGLYEMPKKRWNSAYVFLPDGRQVPERYSKIHRVPFGEYIPWVDLVPPLRDLFFKLFVPELYRFDYTLQQGDDFKLFEVDQYDPGKPTHPNAVRFGTPICFEDAYAYVCRRMIYSNIGSKRGHLLLNLTNDGWFAGTYQPWQEFQLATVRSVENRVPMARAVNTGVSGFIDSAGRVGPIVEVQGKRQDVSGYSVHTMMIDSRSSLYGKVGDIPVYLMIFGTLSWIIAGCWRGPMMPVFRKTVPPTTT